MICFHEEDPPEPKKSGHLTLPIQENISNNSLNITFLRCLDMAKWRFKDYRPISVKRKRRIAYPDSQKYILFFCK
jgi:hypothetical protein